MKTLALLTLTIAACSGDDGPSPDALSGNHPEPAVIPGGGIGSGAIDGVVNVYVVDDRTRAPIADASVHVGEVEGTTDADGLFVAEGLVGAQTVAVTASGYRSEMWLGANGANMTFTMHPANPSPAQATLSGTITSFASVPVQPGHGRVGMVGYSQDDLLDDAENNLKTPANANLCFNTDPCNFSVVTRTGKVTLYALIYDYDGKGTITDTDDTMTLVAYASRAAVTVTSGVNQSGQDLSLIAMGSTAIETVDFGTPPGGLTPALGLIGIELADGSGVIQLPVASPATPMARVPALSAFTGAKYRLTAIAQNTAMPPTQTFVLRKHLTGATLSAGMWTDAPTNPNLSRTHVSWTNSPTGTIHSAEFKSGATEVLHVTSFDGTSEADIPSYIAMPTSTIDGKVVAITALGIDLGDLAIDRDRDKIVGAASAPGQVN